MRFTIPYLSEDPINDPCSLWNVYYKPMLDYLDTLPDYYAQGYDAWFYLTDNKYGNTSYQNVLRTVFRPVRILKVDEDQKALEGAKFRILDSSDATVLEWTSGTSAFNTGEKLTVGENYRIVEVTSPSGYYPVPGVPAFRINGDNTITLLDDGLGCASLNAANWLLTVVNEETRVVVSKVQVSDQSEIAGATLQILDEDGKQGTDRRDTENYG